MNGRLLFSSFLLLFFCDKSDPQQVSPTKLRPVTLDQPFTIEGQKKCNDPLLPFLMSDRSKLFYGCCALKTSNNSKDNCCLLAGSACDILYTNSPRPCRGTPCCPVGKEEDKPYAIVRAFAGNPFSDNLRFVGGFYLNKRAYASTRGGKIPFRNHVFLKNKPAEDLCVDKGGNFTMGRTATFMNLNFMGCCSKAPASTRDSSLHCCLTTFSACNGGIDCCRNAPCYNGMCGFLAGRPEESGYRSKTTTCNSNRVIHRRYATANRSIQVTATGKCATPSLPVFHNFTSKSVPNFRGRTLMACCRNRRYRVSQDISENCCLLENSFCDDSVTCCKGQNCCGNTCGVVAGTAEDEQLVNYPDQPLC